jgi:hypothetical protein
MVCSYSLLDAMSVTMESWTIEHRVFVFEAFIQTGSSVVLNTAQISSSLQCWSTWRRSASEHDIEVGEELQDS